MKKILFVVVHLNYGGAEVGLLTILKSINKDLFDCRVVCIEKKGPVGEAIEAHGLQVTYLNDNARLYNIGLFFKILRILKKERPDVLHTSLFYANFFGRVAALFCRPPVILSEERSMYTEKRFYHVIIDRILSKITDRIIVCSQSVLEFTANQEKIDKTKFCLIYNSVDAGRFPASENTSALREKYGLPIEGYIVGSVGSLISKKGHEVLIEAAAILSKDITDLKVIIVGEGGRKDDLVALASKLGLGKRVVFMGPRDDVPQMMKMMDIFVLPSFQEGFPRTVIEAMYTEIPVVATNISGIPEIISDGDNGILIPAGDANAIAQKCLMLYRNPGLRKSIGINAKKKVESGYMPQDYSCRLEGLYSECLKEKARA